MKVFSRSMRARDLPSDWQSEGHFAPDDRVMVTVAKEEDALSALREGLDQAAAQLDRGEGRPFDREAIEGLIAEVEAEHDALR